MAQLINVKLSRFDGSPWGFRLQGGKDFGTPLVVQKVRLSLSIFFFLLLLLVLLRYFSSFDERECFERGGGASIRMFFIGKSFIYIYIYCSDRTSLTDIACDKSVDSSWIASYSNRSRTFYLKTWLSILFSSLCLLSVTKRKKKKEKKEWKRKKLRYGSTLSPFVASNR